MWNSIFFNGNNVNASDNNGEPLYRLEHMMCHEFVSNKKCMDKELKDKYSQSIKDAMADLLHAKHVGVKTKVHYFVELIRMNL